MAWLNLYFSICRFWNETEYSDSVIWKMKEKMLPYVPPPYFPPHLIFCCAATGALRGRGGHGASVTVGRNRHLWSQAVCTQIMTFKSTKLSFLEIEQLCSVFSCTCCIWEVFILSSTGFRFQYQLFILVSLSIYPFWFIVHLNGLSLWATFQKGSYMLNFLNSCTFETVFLLTLLVNI